jgi:hypothetical protein
MATQEQDLSDFSDCVFEVEMKMSGYLAPVPRNIQARQLMPLA